MILIHMYEKWLIVNNNNTNNNNNFGNRITKYVVAAGKWKISFSIQKSNSILKIGLLIYCWW